MDMVPRVLIQTVHLKKQEVGREERGDTVDGQNPPELHVKGKLSTVSINTTTDDVRPSSDTKSDNRNETNRSGEKEQESLTNYGLSGEGGVDSDSSDSPPSDQDGGDGEELSRERSPLPLPELDSSDRLSSSVFSNPYREAEEARLSVLRRHVDHLSPTVEPVREQRRRGRGKSRRRDRGSRLGLDSGGNSGDSLWTEGDSPATAGGLRQAQKHRSGVAEHLMPPKKFMRIHNKIRSKEQPWTAP